MTQDKSDLSPLAFARSEFLQEWKWRKAGRPHNIEIDTSMRWPVRSPRLDRNLSKLVYFIIVRDTVKIGVSGSLDKRLRSIRTALSHPIEAIYVSSGDHLVEKSLHEKFKDHRLQGEWFTLVAEIKDFIADCVASGIVSIYPK